MSDNIKNIPFSPPDITEEEINEVVDTLKSGWLTTGPKTKELEKRIAEYIGVNKSVCLNSATASMELTLRILGVGPGDEVITSAYTYTATASVIHHVGAKIVLVDTQEDSYEMNYDQLADAITEKTKVIIPVDIAGVICDYDKVLKIVNEKKHMFKATTELQKQFNRIIVMADAAHSFGAKRDGKNSGQLADFSCFSFHAVKNLTTVEGGAVVWNSKLGLDDEQLYKKYMLYSLHGQSKDALSKSQAGSWEYDIVYPAYKCNMTDIMASVGLAQLNRYEASLKKRREIIERYNATFEPLGLKPIQHYGDYFFSSGHLYLLRIPNISESTRNKIITKMSEKGIPCNVHYKPLPMLTAYKNMGFDISNYRSAFNMYKNEVTLPLHTLLDKDDVDYIIKHLINIINNIVQKK